MAKKKASKPSPAAKAASEGMLLSRPTMPTIERCSEDYGWEEARVIRGDVDAYEHAFIRTPPSPSYNTLVGLRQLSEEVCIIQIPGYPIILSRKQAQQLSQWLKKVL